MNTIVESAGDLSPTAPQPSPGALLKLARERAGLALEDLAAQIKLARNTLEALENDNFSSLSEPVYVRGYYRKIAKSLGMADSEVLKAYDQLHPAHAAPVRPQPLPLAGGVDAGISRRAQGQGLLIAGVILVLAMGLLFMFSEPPKTERLLPESAAPEPQVQAVEPSMMEGNPEQGAAVVGADTAAVAEPSASANPVAAVPAPTPAHSTSPAVAQSPPPAAAQAKPIVPESKPVAAAVATSSTTGSRAPTASATHLALQFSESSFVRIEDSRGRTLLVGLVKGGERPDLDGQPPYSVFLGNAANVKVFRGGKTVDFTADINAQNGSARFSVP